MEGTGHPFRHLTTPGTLPAVLQSTYFKAMLGIGKRHRISEKGPSSVSLLCAHQGQPSARAHAYFSHPEVQSVTSSIYYDGI